MAITGLRCLALEPSPSLPRPVQGVNGVLSRMKGLSHGASPRPRLPEPPPRAPTAVAAALRVTGAHLFAGLLLARRPRPQRACKARTCGRNRHREAST